MYGDRPLAYGLWRFRPSTVCTPTVEPSSSAYTSYIAKWRYADQHDYHGSNNHIWQPTPTTNTPSLSTSSQLPPTLPLTTNQQVDEVLSAASLIQSLSPAAVNGLTALLNCTLPPTLPTLRNQPAAITDNSADVSIHTRYLPPVPLKVREHIIKVEYIDFVTLLSKAMFSSSTEPEGTTSFIFQLP